MERFDLIVVGGGAGGLVTAAGSAGIGARVALVEGERLGGECLWTGCVPSKALLACAKAAVHGRQASRLRVRGLQDATIDFGDAMAWMRGAQARIQPNDSAERFRGLGVEVIAGTARFVGERELEVNGRRIGAKRIVIATGSRPLVPRVPGLAEAPYLTNETIFSLGERPAHLIVLGAGPVGVELAQAFVRLGSRVTLVAADDAVLPREEPELSAIAADALRDDGVTIELGATATGVTVRDGGISIAFRGAAGEGSATGSHLLVAVGRQPRTDTADLGIAGIVLSGDDGIDVDDTMRTSARGIWAVGDCVAGAPRLTHVADHQARIVVRNAFFPGRKRVSYAAIPRVTYTDPEIASVGLTEREARQAHGDDVRIWLKPIAELDRAITDGTERGLVKLVTRANGTLLGGHVAAPGAGEMIGEITMALQHRLGIGALADLVHPYPTLSEGIRQAAIEHAKARFTRAPRLLARWFARR